jgi:glycine oxidase
LLGLVWWLVRQKNAPPEIPFAKVTRGTLVSALVTNGRVEPLEWAAVLAERSGVVEAFHAERGMRVKRGDPLAELGAQDARIDLSAAEARDLEPGLPEAVQGAGWFPDDHHVNPTAVTQGLAGAVTRLGGQVRVECSVSELLLDGERVTGVRTAEGPIAAGVVVLAAGAWSGEFQQSVGIPIPILPAKGQIAVARLPEPALRHVVYEEIYVIPRATGEHIIGSTVEYVGFDKGVTVEGIAALLADATRIVPALREAEMVTSYGCLRPASTDGMPLLGPVPDRPGLVLATGHFRNGILLAPITGKLISEAILQGTTTIPLEPFRPDRPFPPGLLPQD